MRRLALLVAWLGVPLSVMLVPFWVGLLRGVLLVGCEIVTIGGQSDTVCRDGNGYILQAAPLAIIGVLASIALVWLHLRFRARPSTARWRAQVAPVIVPAVGAGFLSGHPALLALLGMGVAALLVAVVLGNRVSVVLALTAAAAFICLVVVNAGTASLASLAAVPALVLALSGSYARQYAPPPAAPRTHPR